MSHYPLEIFWSKEDEGFIAEAPDLPGCSAWGATEEDAAREAQQAIQAWLEAARAADRRIPEPTVAEPLDRFSGRFIVRVPRTVHARLARKAKQEGVSLNQLVVAVLARGEL